MLVWLAALAALAWCLQAVPLCLAVVLRAGPDPALGTGLSLFEARFARRAALRRLERPKRRKRPRRKSLRRWGRALGFLLPRLRGELSGVIGLPDAADTALLCGAAGSLAEALSAATRGGFRARLTPDFSGKGVSGELTGMIRLRAGHILTAALIGIFDCKTWRLSAWTDIPSKTS